MGATQCSCPGAFKKENSYDDGESIDGRSQSFFAGGPQKVGSYSTIKFNSANGKETLVWSGSPPKLGLRLCRPMKQDGSDDALQVKALWPGGSAESEGIQAGWFISEVNGMKPDSLGAWELETIIGGRLSKQSLNLENLLDIFDDFRHPFMDVLRGCLKKVGPQEDEYPSFEEKVFDVALIAVPEPSQAASVRRFVRENLSRAENMSSELREGLCKVLLLIDDWKIYSTGDTDRLPPIDKAKLEAAERDHNIVLDDLRRIKVSQEQMASVRRLAFAHFPPELHSFQNFLAIYGNLFRNKATNPDPVAVITVGAPGCGKTVTTEALLNALNLTRDDCVETDPDHWVLNHLNPDQHHYRADANFLNLECFYYAMAQRHHIIFAGTGARLSNTFGRVIARLKEAKYKIYICIVLATFQTCRQRIQSRFAATGRDVPEYISVKFFKDLRDGMPVYVKTRSAYAKAVYIFDNNANTAQTQDNGSRPASPSSPVKICLPGASEDKAQEAYALKLIAQNMALPDANPERTNSSASLQSLLFSYGSRVKPKEGSKLVGLMMRKDRMDMEAALPEDATGVVIHVPFDIVVRPRNADLPVLGEQEFEVEFCVKRRINCKDCAKGKNHKFLDQMVPPNDLDLGIKGFGGSNVPIGTICERPDKNPNTFLLAFLYRGVYKASDLDVYNVPVDDPRACSFVKQRQTEFAELFAKTEQPFLPIPWKGGLQIGAGPRQEVIEKQQFHIAGKKAVEALMDGTASKKKVIHARLTLALWGGIVAAKWGDHEPMNRWFHQSTYVKKAGQREFEATASVQPWQSRGTSWCKRAREVLLAICVDVLSLPPQDVIKLASKVISELLDAIGKSDPCDTNPFSNLDAAIENAVSQLIKDSEAKSDAACTKLSQNLYQRSWTENTNKSGNQAIRVVSMNILAQGTYGSSDKDSLAGGSLNFDDKGFLMLHDKGFEHDEAVRFFFRSWRLIEDLTRHGWPSVVLLQEVDFFEEYLWPVMEALGYCGKFLKKPASAVRRADDGCAVFWRLEDFKGGAWFHMNYPEDWDDGKRTYWPQVVLGVVLEAPQGNVAFASTHLGAEKTPRGEFTRTKQVEQLAKKMSEVQKEYGCVLAVVGCDLNSAPLGAEKCFGYESHAHLQALELFESAYEATMHDEPVFTQWDVQRVNPGIPVHPEKVTLDFILNLRLSNEESRKILKPHRVLQLPNKSAHVKPLPNFHNTSDHFLVAAEYVLPESICL